MLTVSVMAENGRLTRDLGLLRCGKTEEKEKPVTIARMDRSGHAVFSMEHQSAGTAGSGAPNRLTRRNRDIGSPVHLSDSSPSRLLKNNSPSTGECGTKKHARNGRAAKSGIQLLIAGGTGAEGSSAARHPGHGGRGAGAVVAAV